MKGGKKKEIRELGKSWRGQGVKKQTNEKVRGRKPSEVRIQKEKNKQSFLELCRSLSSPQTLLGGWCY